MSKQSEAGFKLIELLIVLGMVSVLTVMSLPYIVNHKKLYKSEDQALKIMDLMREASQTALTRRKTIRLEIDLTANTVLLIDEGRSPDAEFKSVPLEPTRELRVDMIPTGMTKPSPNYTDITFGADTVGHYLGSTSVTGHNVWAARFKSDGTVVNAADVPISANIYIWPPASPGAATPRNTLEVRAITLVGGSGAVRYWRYNGTQFAPFL